MTKQDIFESIPNGAEKIFACNNTDIESLSDFQKTVKLIHDLASDGVITIVGEPYRENTTGYSFVSLIRARKLI